MIRNVIQDRKVDGLDARVDGLVRLEIERDLLFLSFIREDRSNEEHEAVGWDTVIQLETLLGRGDGCKHGETIDTRLDV